MPPEPFRVTDTELAILQTLWDAGPSPIRRITDDLYPGGSTSDYATVQKLLERLEAKGCVTRDRSGFAHVFHAQIGRDELVGQQLENVAAKLCDGSMTPLLMHLVRDTQLSESDRRALRRMLDDAGKEG